MADRITLKGAVAALVVVAAACGGGETTVSTLVDTVVTAPSEAQEAETVAASAAGTSEIDWATVDLSTIDWATIDLATVDWDVVGERADRDGIDFAAMAENPTIGALGEGGGSGGVGGSATLTIGEEVWEFESFRCAIGTEVTQSEIYPFSSSAIGTHSNGNRVQLMAEISDDEEQGRMEGDGVYHWVTIEDVTDFENPTVAWESGDRPGFSPAEPDGDLVWDFDGSNLTATGTFRNNLIAQYGAEPEEGWYVPGHLEATCG